MTSGGESFFAALYDAYYEPIFSYCRRRTTSGRVDDAVAETFLTVWRKLEEVPNEPSTLPWLYGVAYRVVLNDWRAGNRKRRLDRKLRAMGAESRGSPDDMVVVREQVSMALEAAARLRPKDLEVLRLAVWEELPQNQIALVLGISHGAVRQRLLRARAHLLEEYERLERKRARNLRPIEGRAQ